VFAVGSLLFILQLLLLLHHLASTPLPSTLLPIFGFRGSSASFQQLLLKLRDGYGNNAKILCNRSEQTLFCVLCRFTEDTIGVASKPRTIVAACTCHFNFISVFYPEIQPANLTKRFDLVVGHVALVPCMLFV